ncbi:TMAO reductase system periplasmic protein TorT [Paracoccus aminophilus]|uniref:Periplasmic protein TorT n=1 Tax=Paracoccus aminophilus JCM 7686 TaxID=1367847 RepID=S5YI01_PARAH|nr:TMAO reductase system periplasmic protein TorT [Paracoccus aminophilus]AGT11083.1 periplasmic protein TorT [Paracoccus aminophilus JCM 7686]
MTRLKGLFGALAPALVLWLAALPAAAEDWLLDAHLLPFDDQSPTRAMRYEPLDHAARPLRFCILYPHLKDAYWLSVNYGMVREAQRLGVGFELFEAGGYPNLRRQAEQLKACGAGGFDAIILGTVSYDGLTPLIREISQTTPIIATVNDIDPEGISAKSSVSWRDMAAAAGQALAARHPRGSPPVRVAWFPGPKDAGWVRFVEEGFRAALAESSAEIVVTKYGDTGREQQVVLIEEALEEDPDINYLIGNAPMAEAAVAITRNRGLSDRVGIISTYMTHGVFRGVRRGRILAAPSDFPVMQGRLAIEQAVRVVEDRLEVKQAGPRIVVLTPQTITDFDTDEALTPASFVARFSLAPKAADRR